MIACRRHADRIGWLVPVPGQPLKMVCGYCQQAQPRARETWHAVSPVETQCTTPRGELRTLRVGHWWWAMVRGHDDAPGHLVVGCARTLKGARQLARRAAP